jgi:hypothetical protein
LGFQEQPQLWLPTQNNFFFWWEIFAVTIFFFEIFFWVANSMIKLSNFQKNKKIKKICKNPQVSIHGSSR